MSENRLARIEEKLDGLMTVVVDLQSTTADLTVGQAAFEHQFDRVGSGFEKMEREWVIVENALSDLHSVSGLRSQVERGFTEVLYQIDRRIKPLEEASRQFGAQLTDHEQRIAALERRQPAQ